jgi:hypothetical protein
MHIAEPIIVGSPGGCLAMTWSSVRAYPSVLASRVKTSLVFANFSLGSAKRV